MLTRQPPPPTSPRVRPLDIIRCPHLIYFNRRRVINIYICNILAIYIYTSIYLCRARDVSNQWKRSFTWQQCTSLNWPQSWSEIWVGAHSSTRGNSDLPHHPSFRHRSRPRPFSRVRTPPFSCAPTFMLAVLYFWNARIDYTQGRPFLNTEIP